MNRTLVPAARQPACGFFAHTRAGEGVGVAVLIVVNVGVVMLDGVEVTICVGVAVGVLEGPASVGVVVGQPSEEDDSISAAAATILLVSLAGQISIA